VKGEVPTAIAESTIRKSAFPWTRHRGNPHWKPRHGIWTLCLRRGTCHAIVRSGDPRHQASELAGLETAKRFEPFVLRTRVKGFRGVEVRHIGVFEYTELLSLGTTIHDLPTRSGSSIHCGRMAVIQTIRKVPIEKSSIGNRDSRNRESRGQGVHAL
jgi:hypothetical protein